MVRVRFPGGRGAREGFEESPDTGGQRALRKQGTVSRERNRTESAAENKPPMARANSAKSAPRGTGKGEKVG